MSLVDISHTKSYYMKQIIRLNESELRNIIAESVINVLADKKRKCSLINESFVNCKDKAQMYRYADVVWNLLQRSYAYCGGIKNVDSVNELIRDTSLWKLYRKDGEIKAVICYTDRKGGRKMCLMGQDGSDIGRQMAKKMLEDDFRLEDRQSWTGFSGKAAVTALRHGGVPIPSKIALQYVGSKCRAYDDYWYIRPLKNANGEIENHLKLLIGNPPGYKKQEVPQELIDRLIKQALEFGE